MSVVICCYTDERWDDLTRAVSSVSEQEEPPGEVVIAVDHNPELLARCRQIFPTTITVPNQQRRGLSGARNAGVAAAGGDVVVFLDDDARARPGWLAALAAGYTHEAVLGVGGAIVPRWCTAPPSWFPSEFGWVVGCSHPGMPAGGGACRNLIGANMSFRRWVVTELGGFTERIGRVGTRPLGCEETDLCLRLRARWPEGEIRYVPDAVVDHAVTAQRATWAYFRSRCYCEGLSKAIVAARAANRRESLGEEWRYSTRILPAGIARGVGAAVRGSPAGAAQSAAIVAGLAFTGAGYVVGNVRRLIGERA